jgi:hypothetical protein
MMLLCLSMQEEDNIEDTNAKVMDLHFWATYSLLYKLFRL